MSAKISLVHDGSHRAIQAVELGKILETKELKRDVIITCGLSVLDKALKLKIQNPHSLLVSILDPQKDHDKFNLIFVPAHDPYPDLPNIRTTIGLINSISPASIAGNNKLAVLIGGRHIGGNFSANDAERLAEILNGAGMYALITTSKRTEETAVNALTSALRVDYDLYNYNKDGQAINPYHEILAAAEKIIVTADSVRMCSEAASSGKQVFIFTPEQVHFSYIALRDSLFKNGAALDIKNLLDNTPTKTLNEAERVADIILKEANGRQI